jgi:hypothetical protein
VLCMKPLGTVCVKMDGRIRPRLHDRNMTK